MEGFDRYTRMQELIAELQRFLRDNDVPRAEWKMTVACLKFATEIFRETND